ncbi:Thioesterase/thiol ester dehydrase-isomerase [Trichodelitschia bisporula]|uniref:Thioesterase/thiol ester dehydrase-isomerase n=1 Tax=Trichodelitschia bisporula TaxID=703511 RepID=A0A6G1HYN8_9PEZI|nr:Thioesterase/thiol ester dehydrase-isomerase [Trichodelitschia bisporula]
MPPGVLRAAVTGAAARSGGVSTLRYLVLNTPRSGRPHLRTRPYLHTPPAVFGRSHLRWQSTTVDSQQIPASPAPAPRSLLRRFIGFVAITTASFAIGFTMSAAPALETAREALSAPSDEESLLLYLPDADHPAAEINNYILEHPLTKGLTADPKFTASRPHLKIPPTLRPNNFTGGTLMGGDKITVPPLTFVTANGSEFVSVQYLGHALCGHPGIVHGGLLATLLDEGLARCCFPALPNKVGVTASLKIDYRKPCMAGQYVVMKAETTKVEGRKAWVKGRLETLPLEGEGEVLVEAEALFIEPRQAAAMSRLYSPAK